MPFVWGDDSSPETEWGVQGIVAGDMVRRLVARTMAQQLSKAVDAATAPFQCALKMPGANALPFVRLFYGSPSAYLWEQDDGTVHTVEQGEGGEQGDALMPLLHAALTTTRNLAE